MYPCMIAVACCCNPMDHTETVYTVRNRWQSKQVSEYGVSQRNLVILFRPSRQPVPATFIPLISSNQIRKGRY